MSSKDLRFCSWSALAHLVAAVDANSSVLLLRQTLQEDATPVRVCKVIAWIAGLLRLLLLVEQEVGLVDHQDLVHLSHL